VTADVEDEDGKQGVIISIDRNRCLGTGLCVDFAPAVFEMGPDGQAQVRPDPTMLPALLDEVVLNCPTGAIVVESKSRNI
jgi:ferredoxin